MITPNTSPFHNSRTSFPAWRFPNGMMNATDAQLEGGSSSCERWEWGCAGLVVLAVVTELIIVWVHPPYDSTLNEWGTALADAAIAIGIVGEVIFSRKDARIQTELRNRSNRRLGAAVQSAAEANLKAEQLRKAMAWRHLEKGPFLKSVGEISGDAHIAYVRDDPETFHFTQELQMLLSEAGWRLPDPQPIRYLLDDHSLVVSTSPITRVSSIGVTIATGDPDGNPEICSALKALERAILDSVDAVATQTVRHLAKDRLFVIVAPKG
jgi:hypothetical protein